MKRLQELVGGAGDVGAGGIARLVRYLREHAAASA